MRHLFRPRIGHTFARREKGGEHDQETPELAARSAGRFPDASVLARHVRRTPSRRLHRRLTPAARAYYEPGKLLFASRAAGNLYPHFRIAGYHATVAMTDLMIVARTEAAVRFDAVSEGLVPYLDRHLVEEAHDEEPGGLDLKDLAVLGIDPDEVRCSPRPPRLEGLVDHLMLRMVDEHPVIILGFLQLERFHGRPEMVEAFIQRTGLPREAFHNVELHAALEPGHAAEIDRQMDTLPLERWHEDLIFEGAVQTLAALTAVFMDALCE